MLDAVNIERRGIATVTICWERFENAARAKASELHMPSLPLAVVPEPLYWPKSQEEDEECFRRALETVAASLVATKLAAR